jgi:hypothetical protein
MTRGGADVESERVEEIHHFVLPPLGLLHEQKSQ